MTERAESPEGGESVRLWRSAALPAADILLATYVTQSFSWHSHETFAFGVVERGGLTFRFRGTTETAYAGSVTLAMPGEAHTGHGAERSGWRYRMFYVDPAALLDVARSVAPRRVGTPPLVRGVVNDPVLARAIGELHRRTETADATGLELQERLLAVLARFVRVHARWDASPSEKPCTGPALRARTFLDEHPAENISLAELAAVAGCDPFRLIRAFRASFDIPPHAWQLQARVRRAQDLLRSGMTAAYTAAEVGFADQSHLTKVFRRIVGMSPGAYAKAFRNPTT